jgi:hypothetical protein
MGQKVFRGFIVVLAIFVSSWFFNNHGKDAFIFHGDALGYYAYLPSTFIYHNHKNIAELPGDRNINPYIITSFHGWREGNPITPKGYVINQYTYGVALMEAPFFFMAHAWEKLRGGDANGYSEAYMNMIKLAAFVFSLLGLWLVYKILRRYHTANVALVTTLFLLLGTNLFWFTIIQAGMAHVVLFFLYALLVYRVIRLYDAPAPSRFMALGFVAGLITVIRPTDIICLLIPLLYGVYSRETLKARISFIRSNVYGISLAGLAFLIPVIPQLAYWKMLTGSFLYYSYGKQSFNWLHPHIIDGLFYCKNGWLAYSPIMFFAVAGMFLYQRIRPWAWATWVVFLLYTYVIYSWYCYNYINGLGSRPMVHLYPLLAIPLAAFVAFMGTQKVWLKVLFSLVSISFIVLNLNYTEQQSRGILISQDSNLTFNMRMLFRDYLEYNDLVTYDIGDVQPDKNKLTKLYTLGCMGFEDSVSDHYLPDPTGRSKYVYQMKEDEYLPTALDVPYSKEKYKGARWIKLSGRFMYWECVSYRHALTLSIGRGEETILSKHMAIDNKINVPYYNKDRSPLTIDHCAPGVWDEVFFFVKVPADIRDGDVIKCFPWNLPKKNIYLDDLCIELYR